MMSEDSVTITVDDQLRPTSLLYKSAGALSTNRYTHDSVQSFITLSDLEKEKDEMDETVMIDKVLMLQIMYYKKQPREPERVFNKRHGDMGEATYERIAFCRCILSGKGPNLVAIMISKQRNSTLFDHHLSIRDHGGFIPGTIVTVESPQVIESTMGNVPLLDTSSPFRIVDTSNLILPSVGVSSHSGRMSCFHIPSVNMKLLHCSVIETTCKGKLCGGVNLFKGGRIARSCACITNTSKSTGIVMVVRLVVSPPEDEDNNQVFDKFVVADFTSHNFTWMFVKNGAKGIPSGLSAMTINTEGSFLRDYQRKVGRAISKYKFTVTGWSRRGTIQDHGSATKESVMNSVLNHHLVSVTCDDTIDENDKVDLTKMVKNLNCNKRKCPSPGPIDANA